MDLNNWTKPRAFYNEIDPKAAAWLRELIAQGLIADGDVDERSIEDIQPDELDGYTQVHFFAGIGVWSYALRQAGWQDHWPIWTGSCPCQPFSAAGKGDGFADERHLWPHFHWLIDQCHPAKVLGEQVASKDGLGWLNLVQADLEGSGYASGAVDTCAAGFGAPHIRQRLYWVAYTNNEGLEGRGQPGCERAAELAIGASGTAYRLADSDSRERDRIANGEGRLGNGAPTGREQGDGQLERGRAIGGLADSAGSGQQRGRAGEADKGGDPSRIEPKRLCDAGRPRPTNGFWRDADWLLCRDGKWRPVEPSPQQMVDGSADCVGRVRPECIPPITEEIDAWAIRHTINPREGLRTLWDRLSSEALSQQPAGGPFGLFTAPVLLAFLRQLTEQGWDFSDALTCSRAATSQGVLRSLRFYEEVTCSPCGRGLDEQRNTEPPDPMRELSSLVARHAALSWADTCRSYASRGTPLSRNASARMGRLRGYGNAINAAQAQAFIEAVMETL